MITIIKFTLYVLLPGMCLYAVARAIQTHGLDGLLYLWSARLQAAGDAVREYRASMDSYRKQVEAL